MEKASVRLQRAAYITTPKIEGWMMVIACFSLAIHILLLIKLTALKSYSNSFLFIYFINLVPFLFVLASIWLDKRPQYYKHLTFSAEGVSYRSRFLQPEHQFDWEEIDVVKMQPYGLLFQLKNGEEHEVNLDKHQYEKALSEIEEQLSSFAFDKGVLLA